jgi:hypothetical protein
MADPVKQHISLDLSGVCDNKQNFNSEFMEEGVKSPQTPWRDGLAMQSAGYL